MTAQQPQSDPPRSPEELYAEKKRRIKLMFDNGVTQEEPADPSEHFKDLDSF